MKYLINIILMLVFMVTMVAFVIPPLVSGDTISAIIGLVLLILTVIAEAYWVKKVFGKFFVESKKEI